MNRLTALFALISLLALNLLISGCGNSSTTSLMSIVVSPVTPTVKVDLTKQFTAMGIYSDNTTKDISSSVSWSSSDATKATIVASTGLATGISLGTTTITATLFGVTGNTVLTVSNGTSTKLTTGAITDVSNIAGAGIQNTTFDRNTVGPFDYVVHPFTVDTTGTYAATSATLTYTNTTFFLSGLFTPGIPTPTPLSNFIISVFAGSTGPTYTSTFTTIALVAGQQYTALVAFDSTYKVGYASTVTITGPGAVTYN